MIRMKNNLNNNLAVMTRIHLADFDSLLDAGLFSTNDMENGKKE